MQVRRVVTGHDSEGRAIFKIDDAAQPGPVGTVVWSTAKVPVDNSDSSDGADRKEHIVVANGSILRMGILKPGDRSPMHRTQSLDYGIVLDGEIDVELDNGATKRLRKGDVIIQRGTIHAWANNSSAPCTMAWVLIAAEPLVVGDRPLAATDL